MQATYNGVDKKFQYLFQNANHVEFTQYLTTGTLIGELSIDGTPVNLYAPAGGGGGGVYDVRVDNVSVVDSNHIAQLDSSDFGTTVVANPVESATDDLTKVQIGNTVYDIPGGGGGGSVYLNTIYDDTERQVGYYYGRPLYQRTWDLGSNFSFSNNSWTTVAAITGLSNIILVNSLGSQDQSDTAVAKFDTWFDSSNNTIKVRSLRTDNEYVRYITLQYAKNTDSVDPNPQIGNVIYLPTIYSEEERQVGVWTDGKPLYQKTIYAEHLYTSNSGVNTIEADSSYIDTLVDAYGSGYCAKHSQVTTIGNSHRTSQSYSSRILLNTGGSVPMLQVEVGADYQLDDAYITIQYTKTTDTPGSGTWTPDGNLSHHYSNTEHVVGTWIDGSTIWERTWDLGSDVSLSQSTWVDTSISNSNLSMITHSECLTSSGIHRGQVEADVNSTGSYVQLRSDGVNATVRYVTLQYTKTM